MRRLWIIPAGAVALFVLGGAGLAPSVSLGPVSTMGGFAISAAYASRDVAARIDAVEQQRRTHVAAFPRGPYHLNIAGVQNFTRKASQ